MIQPQQRVVKLTSVLQLRTTIENDTHSGKLAMILLVTVMGSYFHVRWFFYHCGLRGYKTRVRSSYGAWEILEKPWKSALKIHGPWK